MTAAFPVTARTRAPSVVAREFGVSPEHLHRLVKGHGLERLDVSKPGAKRRSYRLPESTYLALQRIVRGASREGVTG